MKYFYCISKTFINDLFCIFRVFGPAQVAVFSLIQTISLEGNPLSCGCDQQSMIIWIGANQHEFYKKDRTFGNGIEVRINFYMINR